MKKITLETGGKVTYQQPGLVEDVPAHGTGVGTR